MTKINLSFGGMKQTSSNESEPCPCEIHADNTGVCPQEIYVPKSHFKLILKVA